MLRRIVVSVLYVLFSHKRLCAVTSFIPLEPSTQRTNHLQAHGCGKHLRITITRYAVQPPGPMPVDSRLSWFSANQLSVTQPAKKSGSRHGLGSSTICAHTDQGYHRNLTTLGSEGSSKLSSGSSTRSLQSHWPCSIQYMRLRYWYRISESPIITIDRPDSHASAAALH